MSETLINSNVISKHITYYIIQQYLNVKCYDYVSSPHHSSLSQSASDSCYQFSGGNRYGPKVSSRWCLWSPLLTFGSYSKEDKKCITHCFSFTPLQCPSLQVKFHFLPHFFFVSLYMLIHVCQSPLSSCSLLFSSSPLSIIPLHLISLSLVFQTHCSQTLLSPHINPSLPSSVPHNSIPTGSYIFLHLDTACVTQEMCSLKNKLFLKLCPPNILPAQQNSSFSEIFSTKILKISPKCGTTVTSWQVLTQLLFQKNMTVEQRDFANL